MKLSMFLPIPYFNSIKVRLRRSNRQGRHTLWCNFNSIKVRLRHAFCEYRPGNDRFQFHKGSIKTVLSAWIGNFYCHFNSIKVRLRREGRDKGRTKASSFQFHKGSIKTRPLCRPDLASTHFNSIKVRLRPEVLTTDLRYSTIISIP